MGRRIIEIEGPDGNSPWLEELIKRFQDKGFEVNLASPEPGETIEQLEKELAQTQANLEEANRYKGNFLANMSHEFRTPLNSIIGFSEILLDPSFGTLDTNQQGYVSNILKSGRNLLALINDLLDFSLVEAGKMELVIKQFNVAGLIQETLERVLPVTRAKKISLEFKNEAPELNLNGDLGKFKQIFSNLLSNAVKFTSEGGKIEVSLRGLGKTIELKVSDTGIGIPTQAYDRIFEDFQLLDNVLTKKQRGGGLGLALSRRLAQMQGGTIKVESEPGRGSVFTLWLPLEPLNEAQENLLNANFPLK